MKTIRK